MNACSSRSALRLAGEARHPPGCRFEQNIFEIFGLAHRWFRIFQKRFCPGLSEGLGRTVFLVHPVAAEARALAILSTIKNILFCFGVLFLNVSAPLNAPWGGGKTPTWVQRYQPREDEAGAGARGARRPPGLAGLRSGARRSRPDPAPAPPSPMVFLVLSAGCVSAP